MNVRLIAVTRPVDSAIEDLVAYTARVSNPDNQMNNETAPRLISYLVRNQHWSPFEMAHMVLEIRTTRDIGRQILRHRSFSFQEFSQRYASVKADDVVFREARLQDPQNRQNSIELGVDDDLAYHWDDRQAELAERVRETYDWAIRHGIAKEVARAVLPEGLTPTTMYMAGTVRSWIHYVQERTKSGTQKEHRLIAERVKAILLDQFPALKEVV